MDDEAIHELLRACLRNLGAIPPGYVRVSRDCVAEQEADLQAVDAWVWQHQGRVRRIQAPRPSPALRAGRTVPRPPGPSTVVYEIPRAELFPPEPKIL